MEAVSRWILVFYIPMLIVLALVTYLPAAVALAAERDPEASAVRAALHLQIALADRGVGGERGRKSPVHTTWPFRSRRGGRRGSGQRIEIFVDHQDGLAVGSSARAGSPRSLCGSAARGLRSPRRGSEGAGWSSARGRWRASAVRRRTAGCPCCAAARCRRGKKRIDLVKGPARRPEPRARPSRSDFPRPVRLGKSARPSGTRPNPACAMRYGPAGRSAACSSAKLPRRRRSPVPDR